MVFCGIGQTAPPRWGRIAKTRCAKNRSMTSNDPKSIRELKWQMRGCTLCRDLPLGPKPLFKIAAEARILIVGQAPGRITHEKGVPFDDPSGDRLRDWLGITRATFYDDPRIGILPMGFCFPGSGKSGDLPPRLECAPQWRAQALAAMPDVALTIVIGRYALDWHFPEKKRATLTDVVQAWQAFWPDHVVMPHPSPRNNIWLKRNPWFTTDVLPALRHRVAEVLGA